MSSEPPMAVVPLTSAEAAHARPSTASAVTPAPGPARPTYRVAALVTVLVLALAAAALTVGNVVRGPQLLRAEINPTAAAERTGQRLQLRFDQLIGAVDPDAVQVSPAVPVRLTADPAQLTLRFESALRYATSYQVSIPVQSTATGARSTVRYGFRTPDPVAYLLRRKAPDDPPGTQDEIVRTAPGAPEEVVARGTSIQEFAVSAGRVAYVSAVRDGGDSLTVLTLDGSEPPRTVVADGFVYQVRPASTRGLFGFILSRRDDADGAAAQLQLWDPRSPDTLTGALGIDGKPLGPQNWTFVPGSTAVLAQQADATFYLADPLGRAPTRPIGAHPVLHGFVHNSTTALFEDPGEYTTVDLATGETAHLAKFGQSTEKAVSEVFPLAGKDEFAGLEISLGGASRVVRIRDRRIETLFTPDPGVKITQICAAPNGEYLAVQAVPPGAVSDEYVRLPSFVGAETLLLEVESGRVLSSVRGIDPSWCR